MRKYLVHTSLILIVLMGAGGTTPLASGKQSPSTAIVRVISSDQDGITLEMTTPGVVVEPVVLDGRQYGALEISGCTSSTEPGHPALPVKNVLLGVPPDATLHVTVTILEVEPLPGTVHVAPAPRWVVREEGTMQSLEPVHEPDATAYASQDVTPAEPVRLTQAGYVRSQRVVSLALTPLQYRPASGELHLIRQFRVRLAFSYPNAAAQDRGAPRAEEASFEGILSRSLLNYQESQTWRAGPDSARSSLASRSASWTPPAPAWKVLVNRTGLYRLTYADLQAAGLPVDTLDPGTFQLTNQGTEVAIQVVGQQDGSFDASDYVLFYGQALDTRYTDTNVYWLTYGAAQGLRMSTRNGTKVDAPTAATFTSTARIEENHTYWSNAPSGGDNWFWQSMYATSAVYSVTNPLTATFAGTIGLVATDTHTCTVGIYLYGSTYNNAVNPDHHALVYLNDHLIADASWDHRTPYEAMVEIPSTYLTDITNTIRVDMPADTGSAYDSIYVNRFTLEYQHPYRAVNDELAFTQEVSGTWQYRITGFSDPDILSFDVTDPTNVVSIKGVNWDGYRVFLPLVISDYTGTSATVTAPNDDGYLLRFQDTATDPTDYLVVAAGRAASPLAIVADVPSNLADTTNQADYVIIAHDSLYTNTLPLATYWGTQGMTVQVVRVSDVYDEFSYGVFDPVSIRDFLAQAYANWQTPQLAYVLLVGDATYDYRGYLQQFPALSAHIPTYLMTSPFIGETGSDNWYACVGDDADLLPDLHIGRLPANTPAELDVMVNKILDYAQSPSPGTWNQDVLFVADNADSAGNFDIYSDALVNGYLPPAYTPHKVYYKITHFTQPATTLAITSTIDNGALLVNYIGHGAVYLWAHESLLLCHGGRCDFNDLNNGGKLPFVVSMTCMDGYYFHPDPTFTSLAENWLLKEGGGGIATYAATGLGVATGHDWLNRGLFTAIFTDTMALGPATTESKLFMYGATGGAFQDLIDTYHLFGDPALTLNLP